MGLILIVIEKNETYHKGGDERDGIIKYIIGAMQHVLCFYGSHIIGWRRIDHRPYEKNEQYNA